MNECIFCKIVNGALPTKFIFESNDYIVFEDKYPKANTHLLVVPKMHIKSLRDANAEEFKILSSLFNDLPHIAEQIRLTEGFRTILNTGPGGGQEIDHFHFHLQSTQPYHKGDK